MSQIFHLGLNFNFMTLITKGYQFFLHKMKNENLNARSEILFPAYIDAVHLN